MLLVGSTQTAADEHLLNAKKMDVILTYSQTVPNYQTEKRFRLREEKSKMRMLYIENPYDPENASRIIAIGFAESLAYSWERIDRIHVSDPGQNSRKNQITFFSGLFSRLTNTEGDIKIEGVAGNRTGYFWDLCRKLFPGKLKDDYEDEEYILDPDRGRELEMEEMHTMSSSFEKMFLTDDDGLKVGIITQAWLDYVKGILPYEKYLRIYYCVFAKAQVTIFGDIKGIITSDTGNRYGVIAIYPDYEKDVLERRATLKETIDEAREQGFPINRDYLITELEKRGFNSNNAQL